MTSIPRLHRPVLQAVLAAVLTVFGRGERAEQVVEETLRHSPKWGGRDRRLFASTVYELVRWWRREAWRAGFELGEVIGSRLTPESCARIWAGWWLAEGHAIPEWAEVPSEVRSPHSGWRDLAQSADAVQASIPDWLDLRGGAALEESWPALRSALNVPAPVWLRANRLRATPAVVCAALAREGVEATPHPAGGRHPEALQLASRRRLADSAAFRTGLFEVQDAGSQEIAPFLQAQPGETIIDTCAGAGGKTLHLAALMGNRGRLIAFDLHDWKLRALAQRAIRAGVTCLHHRTLTSPEDLAEWQGEADRVLIDAPCSGLGVLRRHPDTKWKCTPAEIERLVALQRNILDSYSRLVKPGGTLVYATCSFLPEENARQVRAFLDRQPPGTWFLDEERLVIPSPGDPATDHDAYYMARMRAGPALTTGRPGDHHFPC